VCVCFTFVCNLGCPVVYRMSDLKKKIKMGEKIPVIIIFLKKKETSLVRSCSSLFHFFC
jgi:hypothetical protein